MSDIKTIDQIAASAVYKDNNIIWFSAMEHNGLYCHDLLKNSTKYVSSFPEEDLYDWKLHIGVIKNKECMIFIPDRAKNIHLFDTLTGDVDSIAVGVNSRGGFFCEQVLDGKIYFIKYSDDAEIVEFDPDHKETSFYTIKDKIACKEVFTSTCVAVGGTIYFADREIDRLYGFNVLTHETEIIQIDCEKKGFGTITYNEGCIWLSSEKYVIKYSINDKRVEKIRIPEGCLTMTVLEDDHIIKHNCFIGNILPNEKPFSFSLKNKNDIIFFPFRTDRIMIVKNEGINNRIEFLDLDKPEIETNATMFRTNRLAYSHYIYNGNGCYSSTTTQFFYYPSEIGDYCSVAFYKDCKGLYRNTIKRNFSTVLREENSSALKDYIDAINDVEVDKYGD